MDRKIKGRVAEAKVIAYLASCGYEIYKPLFDNSKYDLLYLDSGNVIKVSVKFCSTKTPSGSWRVEMRQVSRRKGHVQVDKFMASEYDFVAVYVEPEDKVYMVPSERATSNIITISVSTASSNLVAAAPSI